MVFHRSLSDREFPQVSRTLLSILAVLNNVVVWMASTRPLISKSSSPFINPLVSVPRVPIIIIDINVTFMFHSCCFFFFCFFFCSIPGQCPGFYSSFHLYSILLCGQPEQQSPQFCTFPFSVFFFFFFF